MRCKRPYRSPEVVEVSLVPEEAVLEVCKHHDNPGEFAVDLPRCSWPGGAGGGNCKGVTGS